MKVRVGPGAALGLMLSCAVALREESKRLAVRSTVSPQSRCVKNPVRTDVAHERQLFAIFGIGPTAYPLSISIKT